jgi:predicted DsbA family dithiol-disulfide isomerase
MKDNVVNEQLSADQIDITYYTDPLCCWSWAFEPQWRRLHYEYSDKIRVRYVMVGLIPSWNAFNDPAYSVSRPQQMGPVWMEAAQSSGMPMNDKLWVTNPPASSFPACIAVKCAELQSKDAGEKYLRLLREAVMLSGENIAEQKVLVKLFSSLAECYPEVLDTKRFEIDLTGIAGLEAFRKDWQEVQNRNINRFPSLIIRPAGGAAIITTGYRPYTALIDAIKQVSPTIKKTREITSIEAYIDYFGTTTDREIQEVVPSLSTPRQVLNNE